MLWSILLLFRVFVVLTAFQFNGAYDLIYAFIVSIAVIVQRATSLTEPENIVWLVAPILTAVIGLSLS